MLSSLFQKKRRFQSSLFPLPRLFPFCLLVYLFQPLRIHTPQELCKVNTPESSPSGVQACTENQRSHQDLSQNPRDYWAWTLIGLVHYETKQAALFQLPHLDGYRLLLGDPSAEPFTILALSSEGIWIKSSDSEDEPMFWALEQSFSGTFDLSKAQKIARGSESEHNCLAVRGAPFFQLINLLGAVGIKAYPIDDLCFLDRLLLSTSPNLFFNQEKFKTEMLDFFRLTERPEGLRPHLALAQNETSGCVSSQRNSGYARLSLKHILLAEEWEPLKKELQGKISPTGKLFFDLRRNNIEIWDHIEHLLCIFHWFSGKDRPTPQFYLDARVFFCTNDMTTRVGFDQASWVKAGPHGDVPPRKKKSREPIEEEPKDSFLRHIFPHLFPSDDAFWNMGKQLIDQALNQLESERKITMLSKPFLVVRNQRRAIFRQESAFGVREGNKKKDSSKSPRQFQFEVTPSWINSTDIFLKLSLTQTAPTPIECNSLLTETIAHHFETELIATPNQPIVLGGLMQNQVGQESSGPMCLKWMPWRFLRGKISREERQEVLILILFIKSSEEKTHSECAFSICEPRKTLSSD